MWVEVIVCNISVVFLDRVIYVVAGAYDTERLYFNESKTYLGPQCKFARSVKLWFMVIVSCRVLGGR